MAKKVQPKKAQAKKAVPAVKAGLKAVKKTAPASIVAPAKKTTKKVAPERETPKKVTGKGVKVEKLAVKGIVSKKEVKKKEVVPTAKKEVATPPKKEERKAAVPEVDIRTILLKRRDDLLKEIVGSRARESDPLKREVGDIYDEASSERERELSLLLGDRDRQKLKEIDEALQRIESGEYGICESCGDKIAPGRLKAQPFTKLCINCKSEEERQEARQKKFEAEGVYRNVSYGEEEEG